MDAIKDSATLWRLVGACAFVIYDASAWTPLHYALWIVIIAAGMELLSKLTMLGGYIFGFHQPSRTIPQTGWHLDNFETIDMIYITINKLLTAAFTYHVIRYAWTSPYIAWSLEEVSLINTVVALVCLYLLYDVGYAAFHRLLHARAFYPWVHKHHHRQKAPSRGNADAINVHWFEFVVGEYNHLLTIHLIAVAFSAAFGVAKPVHLGTIVVFILLGGVLASLNHTRFDIRFPIPGLSFVYQVRYHDLHHWDIKFNYGQYTMVMDWLMGTFKPYPEAGGLAAAAKEASVKDE